MVKSFHSDRDNIIQPNADYVIQPTSKEETAQNRKDQQCSRVQKQKIQIQNSICHIQVEYIIDPVHVWKVCGSG